MPDMRTQAVMGVLAPETAEAILVIRWPSVARAGIARLGSTLQERANALFRWTIALPAPAAALLLFITVPVSFALGCAAWGLLAPVYFGKLLPFTMTRYVLTNRRLMIQKGWALTPVAEAKLDEIHEVRVAAGSEQPFYLSADLEIVSNGQVALTLPGVPEYQGFKVMIENAYLAWGRKSPPKEQIHPATEMAGKK